MSALDAAPLNRIAVETTAVAVLADGDSSSAISNARGRLLEDFLAQLLASLGYEDPSTEDLRVTSEGIEIDLVARMRVTGQRLIAECKAYSANVPAPLLTSFVGKYLLARADDEQLAGLFLALPRLTAEAKEKAEVVRSKFPLFKYLGAADVCGLLEGAGYLPRLDDGPTLSSDLTVLITPYGVGLAARELDPRTRHAARLVVWTKGKVVPDPMRELVERSPLAEGLPVGTVGDGSVSVPVSRPEAPAIVAVQASTSDFEYQLPAAPKFFIGRKALSDTLRQTVRDRSRAGVVVVNAKSGWGKSSLALRLAGRVRQDGGVALVADTRTADSPEFVSAAVERVVRDAVSRRLLRLPEDAAFSSLTSSVQSLASAEWRRDRPLLLFFDQFENAFRSEALTREFRDLVALISELDVPVTIGFAWKTDLVGWTEEYPYRLRDEIRDSADVALLEPLRPREIETLLRRLEKAIGEKLHRELRRRLREYSQGLPWLFKKLASHILVQVGEGATQEGLVRESLNVQRLFESDLAELSPAEREALTSIARTAPVLVSELEDTIPSSIVQSLLNRRLVVQVGERVDTYWDIFRDFLVTGQVAIEDSYIMRYGPASVGRVIRRALISEGGVSVPDAAAALGTSSTVVFNLARELRLMGLIADEPNQISVVPAVLNAPDREAACRDLVGRALRRHKILGIVTSRLGDTGHSIGLAEIAEDLPLAFPAVEAKAESWLTYARVFCQWLAYAGLVGLSRDGVTVPAAGQQGEQFTLLSGVAPVRVRGAFPQGPAGPARELLLHLTDSSLPPPEGRRLRAAMQDLSRLGAIALDERERVTLTKPSLVQHGEVDPATLEELLGAKSGVQEALEFLRANPAASPAELGEILREAHGAEWTDETARGVGKYVRSWARLAGIETRLRRGRKTRRKRQAQPSVGQPSLLDDIVSPRE